MRDAEEGLGFAVELGGGGTFCGSEGDAEATERAGVVATEDELERELAVGRGDRFFEDEDCFVRAAFCAGGAPSGLGVAVDGEGSGGGTAEVVFAVAFGGGGEAERLTA